MSEKVEIPIASPSVIDVLARVVATLKHVAQAQQTLPEGIASQYVPLPEAVVSGAVQEGEALLEFLRLPASLRLPALAHKTNEYSEECGECLRERRAVEVNHVRIAKAARTVRRVLEAVDCRASAADGPVTPTKEEITKREFRRLYQAAKEIAAAST